MSENFNNSNPLKVLLPDIGDLSNLRNFIEEFQANFLSLRVEREKKINAEEDFEYSDAEEQMLIQVMQWLSAGEEN